MVTKASKKDNMMLKRVSYIYHFIWFKKDKVRLLINFDNKINVIISVYTSKLGLNTRHTNVRTQKIDRSTFKTFEMLLANF